MGNNFTISVNLQKMKNAGLFTIQGKTGKKRCICIPVDDNPEIFVGEKGVYLGLIAIERKEVSERSETHIVKGNLPKKVRDAMSEEERKAQPILGSVYAIGQSAPSVGVVTAGTESGAAVSEVEEDLPF